MVKRYGEKQEKEFICPHDVAVGPNNEVVILDNEAVILDKNLKFVRSFGRGTGDSGLNSPVGVAIYQDVIAISEYDHHVVKKFSLQGDYLSKFGSLGNEDGQFKNPQGLCFNSKGLLYVVDHYNDRVQVFNHDDKFSSKFGSRGRDEGQFQNPRYIAMDSRDQVYVTDCDNGIIMFTENGKFIKKLFCDQPFAISITPDDYIITSDKRIHCLVVFSPTHQLISKFGDSDREKGQFVDIYGIAISTNGTIFIVECSNRRLQVITI